jgi:predicted DsbA family dithiol-disulfide isomerase
MSSIDVTVPLRIRLYSDFVCPFCFIAEQSTLPRLLQEFDLAVEWCGFELHPGTPKGGMPLSTLFPPARLPALRAQMQQFAARFGISAIDQPDHIPNSRRALAIAEWARDRGQLDAFRESAMVAHWREARNLENDDDLRAIAARVGLDPDQALAAADDPAILARVDRRQIDARQHGVTGIPTFFIGEEEVVGCQPYEVLAAAARRAGARPRAPTAGDPRGRGAAPDEGNRR